MSSSVKIAKISLVISVVALIGIFIPGIIGVDGMSGGFAISTICTFILLTAIIIAIIFWQMARNEAKIKKGENLIAHWKYSKEEWSKFTKTEYKLDRSYKITLLYIIMFFAIVFGACFWIYDPENGIYVFYSMIGLIALITFVAYYSIWLSHKNNLSSHGEVYISTQGVIINDQFHSWKILGAKLENIRYNRDAKPKYLEFEYSTIARYGREMNYVRVPVPESEENKVVEIMKNIQ